MRKHKNVVGTCRLCSAVGPLSFEHVPPKAAFNRDPLRHADFKRLIACDLLRELDNPVGRVVQGGAGNHTLCERCNNVTGSWYAPAYIDVVTQLWNPSFDVEPNKTVSTVVRLRPLNVLKHILTMFCSACAPGFTAHPELTRFILSKDSRELPGSLEVLVGLFASGHSKLMRQSGISAVMDMSNKRTAVFSEICYPPFVLIMSVGDRRPDPRLLDIGWFKNYEFDEEVDRFLMMPSLSVNTYLPAQYLTLNAIREMSDRNAA